jgi:hypothetical protein
MVAALLEGGGQLSELAGHCGRCRQSRCQGLVRLLQVEVVRMPVHRQSLVGVGGRLEDVREQLLCMPAPHPCRQFLVSADPAAVLGWAGHLACEAARRRRWIVQHRLDRKGVVPAVAKS